MAAPGRSGQAFVRVLGSRQAQQVMLAGLIGRFREAGTAFALVLAIRSVHGSFGAAGAGSAAYLAGAALTRPLHGRWVDQAGARVPLLTASALNSLMLSVLAIAVWQHATAWLLVVLGALVGVTLPALSAALRSLWPLLAPSDGDHAYALDTVSYELSLIASPALVGVIAIASSPSLALLVLAALGFGGTVGVATSTAAASHEPSPETLGDGAGWFGSPILVLVLISLFVGAAEGSLTVLAPGVSAARHDHDASGLLLSSVAAGSLAGAFLYALLSNRAGLVARLLVCAAGLTLACVLFALFGATIAGFAISGALVGLMLSPTLTVGFVAIRTFARPGTLTQAFTWASFAATAGAAVSQAVAGMLITGPGVNSALWVAPAAAAVGLGTAAFAAPLLRLRSP